MKKLVKNILLSTSTIFLISGCVSSISNESPLRSSPNVPQVKYVRFLPDRNAIGLEWGIVNRPEIAGYYIQRSSDGTHFETIKKIKSRYVGHWTDTDLKPGHKYIYKISTFNKKGVPSFAKQIKARTLPTIPPVPFIADAHLKAEGMIKIIFRPSPNERVEEYKIQRFNDEKGRWETIDTIEPRLSAEFIDKNLVDGKIYQYRIISISYDGLESPPSKVVRAKTLEKPATIIEVIATTNLPKKISLNWNKIEDGVKYKVYASDSPYGEFKLKAITSKPFYDDVINRDGAVRYYKVTSVDKYGIESIMPKTPVMGATLALPAKPIVSIVKGDKSVKFILSSPDGRASKYLIKKDDGERIINIHNVQSGWTDRDVHSNHKYTYKIYAIDEFGLISKPKTIEVSF